MANHVVQYLYSEIKKSKSFEDVGHFWTNILYDYFPKSKSFVVTQARPLPGKAKEKVDFNIRYIQNGPKKVILFENKGRGAEFEDSEWMKALEQLVLYFRLVVEEDRERRNGILYGAVTIGTHIRFYYFDVKLGEAYDYECGETGKAFELKEDEEKVHTILSELAVKAAR